MSEKLQILIEALWRGKGDVAAAKKSIGELSKSTEEASAKTKSLGERYPALKLAAVSALTGIGYAMVRFGQQSVAMASWVEESASKFRYVFGPAAEEAGSALDEFAQIAGRSKYALRDTAAGFGGILEGVLGSKEAAADMSVELTKLTTDLASFYNVAEQDAARALTSGLIGEAEPMRRFGVLLSAAAIETEILSSGMARTKEEITEAMKVQARYNLMLEATSTAQGDAVRTSDSYENTVRAQKAAVEELSVSLGQLLLPVMTDVSRALTDATKDLGILFEVQKNAQPVISGIVKEQINQANSIDDLADAYKRATDQIGLWSHIIGVTDELYGAQKAYLDEIGKSANSFDEYIAALIRAEIVGDRITDTQRELFRSWYDAAQATKVYETAVKQATSADQVMLQYLDKKVTALGFGENAMNFFRYATERGTKAVESQSRRMEDHQRAFTRKMGTMQDAYREEQRLLEESQRAYDAYSDTLTGAYFDALTNVSTAQQEANEKTRGHESALFDLIVQAGATTEQIGMAGVALGLYTKEQAEAALQAMIMQDRLQKLAQSFNDGEISAYDMRQQLEELVNGSPYTAATKLDFENALSRANIIKTLLDGLDGRVVRSRIEVDSGGGGGGGVPVPSEPIPGGDKGGDKGGGLPGGAQNININVNAQGAAAGVGSDVQRAVNAALAAAGIAADSRRRMSYVSI